MAKYIKVTGARENNLKNINITMPRDKFIVMTGLSGSGKSSLAFDTIYAEGHRKFVQSLSSYARQFLGQINKPDVDSIEGLSPAIAIDQKTTSKNPRSTVGTVTEIYDYLRLLYARLGIPHCPVCGKEISQQSTDQILERIMKLPEGTRFMVLSPVVRGKKGMHEKELESAKKRGFVRIIIDDIMYELSEDIDLDKNKKHTIEIVVDRLIMKQDLRPRLTDSIETAIRESNGSVKIQIVDQSNKIADSIEFSTNFACEDHNISIGKLEPRLFSFNNPFGACKKCSGLGIMTRIGEDKIMPDRSLSLLDGGLAINGFKTLGPETWTGPLVEAVGKMHGFKMDQPLDSFSDEAMKALLYGTGNEVYDIVRGFNGYYRRQKTNYDGIIPMIKTRMEAEQGKAEGEYYEQFVEELPCPECNGQRLNDIALAVTVGGKNISEFCDMSVSKALSFLNDLKLNNMQTQIGKEILKEINSRLTFLKSVGLDYLTLSRRSGTLSGGEAQRIRLATQIGSSLVGVLYILDEPSIGLHQRDNKKLIATLKKLRDLGNTVIVVEHDEETMMNADYLIDIGPGAGIHGGKVVAAGTPEEVMKCKDSVTADFLSGRRKINVPSVRREGNGHILTIRGARENNLKNIDVSFPLGTFSCVTGVSGSGKSSLINSILYKSLASKLNRASTWPGDHDLIEGYEYLDKVINIDQSPIGRSPRSNPATYTGLFTDIRELFAKTPDAKMRGYKAGRFSFNIRGGRCEACEGDGVKCIEMHFLPDVYVTCDVCNGKRYNRETLEVKYKGKNISEVLDMTAEEGVDFFSEVPKLSRRLKTLCEVGLGYVKIGQSSITLSGGEAQRVKLATELSRKSTGKTLYILDEPTTGLHSADVERLISVLQALVNAGNTVIVIEHNLDMIKSADYVVDLGPEGGDLGGNIVTYGTPEKVSRCNGSYTGQFLKNILENS